MRVIIAGSRSINNQSIVEEAIKNSGFEITEVVSGNAKGVDICGELYAIKNNLPAMLFPANWSKYGKSAGPIRNQLMADYADALIAIPGKDSKGTWDMIRKANAKGLKVYIYKGYL